MATKKGTEGGGGRCRVWWKSIYGVWPDIAPLAGLEWSPLGGVDGWKPPPEGPTG